MLLYFKWGITFFSLFILIFHGWNIFSSSHTRSYLVWLGSTVKSYSSADYRGFNSFQFTYKDKHDYHQGAQVNNMETIQQSRLSKQQSNCQCTFGPEFKAFLIVMCSVLPVVWKGNLHHVLKTSCYFPKHHINQ